MDRHDMRLDARRLLLIAVGIGVLGDIVLDGSAAGINVPLMTATVLAAAWVLRRRGRAPDPLDAWLPIAAIVLAAFVAVRADPFLAALDLAGAAAFTGASVAAFSGLAVTRRSLSTILVMGAWIVESALAGAARLLILARPAPRDTPRTWPIWLGSVARGLALAVPLVLIFAVLFASADPIFRRGFEEVVGFRIDLGTLPGRLVFVAAIAWLVAGLLVVAARGLPAVEAASLGAAAPSTTIGLGRSLGTTEALIVLGAVDAVVGLFVVLQVAYLFGGLDTLAAAGMRYSDYARRGYFELVAAAGLAGGLLVFLEYQVTARPRVYLTAAIAFVGLTLVVLASAVLRLQLYQDAYGWTELRLYVAVSIAAMAATLATLAAFLATDRTRWLGHVMGVIGLASLVALNLIAPAAFVAERNLQRIIDPSLVPPDGEATLDADYLGVLPDDAVPVLVAALPQLPGNDAFRVRNVLERRERELLDPAYRTAFAWNVGRERARAALETVPD
ncbi:MAG TPA: DUF4173 domain-containing protein [Candidatus Limnocylindrales bacterium]|nr:DUF4173 domain-containing protein [Candidatus Limnocylindrales bacterium]